MGTVNDLGGHRNVPIWAAGAVRGGDHYALEARPVYVRHIVAFITLDVTYTDTAADGRHIANLVLDAVNANELASSVS